ncbi:hypothetical protein LCGC14_1873230 [marine sediment metagenome]|uniref:Uncharacterized protein n=1 Tax=marine sediment metagenome TaxID=412755 RepID=A0A0F9J335_9ZZZZ
MKKKVGVYYDFQNIYDASYDLEEYKIQIDFRNAVIMRILNQNHLELSSMMCQDMS